jgi:hypothetical protein
MTTLAETLGELAQIRSLLLAPTSSALRDCERKLLKVIRAVSETGDRYSKSSDVKRLIRDIHRLLENARRFWDWRHAKASLGRQYAPGGALSADSLASTFVIEV